jgi:hypothetical protein
VLRAVGVGVGGVGTDPGTAGVPGPISEVTRAHDLPRPLVRHLQFELFSGRLPHRHRQ